MLHGLVATFQNYFIERLPTFISIATMMLFTRLQRKSSAIRCLFSTYYDSQSGRYMNVPGTQALRLHDVTSKIDTTLPLTANKLKDSAIVVIENVQALSVIEKLSSITALTGIKRFYFPNTFFESLHSIPFDSKGNYEFDCYEHLNQSHSFGLDAIGDCIKEFRAKTTSLNIRVNLPIDISSLISDGRPSQSVMDIVTSVGKLCDWDIEVVNLVFCQNVALNEDLLDRQDDVVDYVREIIEECNGLDVPGAAVIDRLSLQACHSDILDLAKSLGVRRFAVLNKAVAGGIRYKMDDELEFCSIEDSKNYDY